jgi:hypothetical protein
MAYNPTVVLARPTLAALKAVAVPYPEGVQTACRTTPGDNGGGIFIFRTGDQSANVTADPQSGVWVAPNSASTGASGAWERLFDDALYVEWFGAATGGTAAPVQACLDYALAIGASVKFYSQSIIDVDDDLTAYVAVDQQGALLRQTTKFKGLWIAQDNFKLRNARAEYTTPRGFAIASISNANPAVVVTTSPHGFATGNAVIINNCLGMTEINGLSRAVTVTNTTTFTFPVNTTAYGVYTGSGTASHRPSTGGQGFSGWQAITAVWVEGDDVEVEDLVATNFYSAICLRGPIVLEPLSTTGYDHSVQSQRFKARNTKAVTCDFVITGSSQNGPIIDGTELLTPTQYTVPPHAIYFQSPTVSGQPISDVRTSPSTEICIVTTSGHGFESGYSYTVSGVQGTTEANTTAVGTTAYAVSNVANNGSGLFRVTTTTHPLVTGDEVTLTSVGGSTGINGDWTVTVINSTTFDLDGSTFAGVYTSGGTATTPYLVLLQGTVFVNAYTTGGQIVPTYEGYVDRATVSNVRLTDFTYAEAVKLSNIRDSTIIGLYIDNCIEGGLTLSYAWRNVVVAPHIYGVAAAMYGIRQTDDLGDDNQVIGGVITGAQNAHYLAITNSGLGTRLTARGVTAISNYPIASSAGGTVRTFNNAVGGTAIFSDCVDIQIQSNSDYSYGNGTNGGELIINNPVQRGRVGLLRSGTGATTRLTFNPALVDSFDPASSSCILNTGTLTLTAFPSLNADNTFTQAVLSSSPTKGVGYATGAGGAATQSTDKSTTVVLSKASGRITMNAANLNAGASVSFTLTNTAIAATDYLSVKHESGGTLGAYTIRSAEGSGSAVITVTNTTGGALAEAIVLKFVLVKAVAS